MFIEYPVKDHKISQLFGNDVSQDLIYSEFYKIFDNKHCGVDFPVPVGTKVFASFGGVVVRKENHQGMGNVVGIRDGNIVALYSHLSSILVHLGDTVTVSTLIGLSGRSGAACPTPHLHFELRDLTKETLRDMVFNPPFEKEVPQFQNRFQYLVNNQNSQKTLKKLAVLYFGTETRWDLIRKVNKINQGADTFLEEGKRVIIPNYNDIK